MAAQILDRCSKAMRLGLFVAIAALSFMVLTTSTSFAQDDPPTVPPSDRPTCAEHCAAKAEKLQARCEEGGGENCAERAAEFLTKCEERCALAGERREKREEKRAECASNCEERAAEFLARCEEGGGDNCAAKAERALKRCQHRCDSIGRRPGPRDPGPREPGEPRDPAPGPREPGEPGEPPSRPGRP